MKTLILVHKLLSLIASLIKINHSSIANYRQERQEIVEEGVVLDMMEQAEKKRQRLNNPKKGRIESILLKTGTEIEEHPRKETTRRRL